MDDCAATWETDASIAGRTRAACVAYLWQVHGVDYFAGAVLRASLGACALPPRDCGPLARRHGAVARGPQDAAITHARAARGKRQERKR